MNTTIKTHSNLRTFILEKEDDHNIRKQFLNRSDFFCKIISISPDEYTRSLISIIMEILKDPNEITNDYLIFCLNDHVFDDSFNVDILRDNIQKMIDLDCEVFVGGLSYFCCSVQIDNHLSWVESIGSAQFIIIFKPFYEIFSTSEVLFNETLYGRISRLSKNKVVLHPFISHSVNKVKSDLDIKAFRLFDQISNFYKNLSQDYKQEIYEQNFDDISIPTFIINLKERTDRLHHIINQFKGRKEFDIKIVDAQKHRIGAVGLWLSIREIIKQAIHSDEDVIIICEDDHEFTNDYCKKNLLQHIFEGFNERADYINGGTSVINVVVPVAKERYWVDMTRATQFMIIYKKFFKKIIEYDFNEDVIGDIVMSNLAETKMIIYPLISRQHNFGYSDVTPKHNQYIDLVDDMFSNTERRLSQIKSALDKYTLI